MRRRALWLSRLLKLEFTYRVGATPDEIFFQNLAFLERIGAVAVREGMVRPGPDPDVLHFLAEFMRAYLEAYRLTAETALETLAPERRGAALGLDRKALVKEALERGRAAFLSGRLALRESLSKATIENAAEWLVTQGIIAEQGGRLSFADGTGAELRAIVDEITPQFAA